MRDFCKWFFEVSVCEREMKLSRAVAAVAEVCGGAGG